MKGLPGNRIPLIFFFTVLTLFSGCSAPEDPWLLDDQTIRKEQVQLLTLLEESENYEDRFSLAEQVIGLMNRNNSETRALFLEKLITEDPKDPFSANYLLALARYYYEQEIPELAKPVFQRILKTTPDLIIHGESIHFTTLKTLLTMELSTEEQREIHESLLQRFPDRIDQGRSWYLLGEIYEALGEWELSITAWEKYMAFPDTEIRNRPKARESVAEKLQFHYSNKKWVREDLDSLVNTIKYYIRTRNAPQLNKYRAEDFFVMSWESDTSDPFTHIPIVMSAFLKSSVRYMRNMEPYSNDSEAYLKTWGWSWRVQIWYLYFKRVDYPADPEINGSWEWAGIYLGERL